MKVLVTGGSGRIGRYVVRDLVDAGHEVTSVDVSDPRNPVIVATIEVGDGSEPHWTQVDPGTNRFILTGDGPSGSVVQLYQVDLETGQMTLDESFGALQMERDLWPHGATGAAVPHAALFGR